MSPNGYLDRHPPAERLEDDAVALGQLHELRESVLVGVMPDVEDEPDSAEADRHVLVLGHPERAAEIQVPFGTQAAGNVGVTCFGLANAGRPFRFAAWNSRN